MIDVSKAFVNGRKGMSIWKSGGKYQASVRQSDGSFAIGIDDDLGVAYAIALRDDVLRDDLL